jgi:cell division protein FtsN
MRQQSKQRILDLFLKNNMVLSFFAGLCAGLIIAIVVALAVTRSSMQFHGGKKQEKSVAVISPSADPNQPMYSSSRETPAQGDATTPPSPAAIAKTEDAKGSAYLQTGAYRTQAEATGMQARLALLGIEAHINEVSSPGGTLFRVRVGPLTAGELSRTQGKLKENQIDYTDTKSSE